MEIGHNSETWKSKQALYSTGIYESGEELLKNYPYNNNQGGQDQILIRSGPWLRLKNQWYISFKTSCDYWVQKWRILPWRLEVKVWNLDSYKRRHTNQFKRAYYLTDWKNGCDCDI